jgi:hypothetical protein
MCAALGNVSSGAGALPGVVGRHTAWVHAGRVGRPGGIDSASKDLGVDAFVAFTLPQHHELAVAVGSFRFDLTASLVDDDEITPCIGKQTKIIRR